MGKGSSFFGSNHQRVNDWHHDGALRLFGWHRRHLRATHSKTDSSIQLKFTVLAKCSNGGFRCWLNVRLRLRVCTFWQLLLLGILRFCGRREGRRSIRSKTKRRSHIVLERLRDGREQKAFGLARKLANAYARFLLLQEAYESIHCRASSIVKIASVDAWPQRIPGHPQQSLRIAFCWASLVQKEGRPFSTKGTLCDSRS